MIWFFLLWTLGEIVANEELPKTSIKITLTNDLILGNAKTDQQVFTFGTVLTTDRHDNIFVLDPGNFRVAIFDKQGLFQSEFGGEGQGPGEFQEPVALTVDRDDRIAVFDTGSKKLIYFDGRGQFLAETGLEFGTQVVTNPNFLQNGNVVYGSIKTDAHGGVFYDLSLYDKHLKPLKNIASVPQPKKYWRQAGSQHFWVGFLKDQFEVHANGYPLCLAYGDRNFVAANTKSYGGVIFDQDGNVVGSFSKKLRPKPFTENNKNLFFENIWQNLLTNPFLAHNMPRPVFDMALGNAKVPGYIPPLQAMFRMGESGFAFLGNYDTIKRIGQLDVFNAKGECIAVLPYTGPTLYFHGKNGQFYAVGIDEDDDIIIKRYLVDGL